MSPPLLPHDIIQHRLAVLAKHGGSLTKAARELGINRSTLQNTIDASERVTRSLAPGVATHAGRVDLRVEDGVVLVGSDAHIWPSDPTTAMRAFEWACRELKPRAVILNGDVVDGATISRHPSIGWEDKPTLIAELGAVQAQLRALQALAGAAERIWTLGNHDARFETAIANALPDFAHVPGVHLKDHFPDWQTAWSVWINDETVIKHRFRSGVHATWNNTLNAGKTIVTGHLHSLRVTPLSDYNGTRWGVDTGTLAAPYGPQFVHYTEANPVNWRAGFVVLTFRAGKLLWPELVPVISETQWSFRGAVYER